ncbi:MAG: DUF721 domain-containing protein [Bacteroidales bacterium]|nr:DUF721 domain-containing protein [Bacteroidales bacterium]
MPGKDTVRIARKQAQSMDEVVAEFIRAMKLASNVNEQIISDAWDKASGAGRWTVDRQVRGGVLYCTMSSSVVRDRLYFQREALVESVNRIAFEDPLFVKDDPKCSMIHNIILK